MAIVSATEMTIGTSEQEHQQTGNYISITSNPIPPLPTHINFLSKPLTNEDNLTNLEEEGGRHALSN